MMSSVSPKTYISESGLRVGHLHAYHLFNKVPDVSTFLCNQCPFIHLFGLSETRFNCYVSDKSIAIPHYTIYIRDIVKQGETGLALYVHNSIQNITPLGVLTWSHNALKAFAILKHRPC